MRPSAPAPPLEMSLDQRIEMTAAARDADAIAKVAGAGAVYVEEGGERVQRMHNGLKVVADGYCGAWMTQLIERCRGHHEPQEEWAFHSLVERLPDRAAMLEIGGSWSYYSMWFLKGRPRRRAIVVEPDPNGVALAARNFALNGLSAEICQGYVGERYAAFAESMPDPPPPIRLPELMREKRLDFVDLLHCDAQGAELELIESCADMLRAGEVGWVFVSTHGAAITGDPLTHQKCLAELRAVGAEIVAEHDVHESFSGDGLIVARFGAAPLDWTFPPLSRNRYSTSYYRNPLYDVAAASDPSASNAAAACEPPKPPAAEAPAGPVEAVGVWLELRADSALGRAGDRILSPTDGVLLPYLREHGEWHTEPLELAKAHLDAAADYALVDIGANIGLFSRQFLSAFPAIRTCLCVEPDRRNLEALEFNLRKFRDRDLRVFPFALGGCTETATFYRDRENIGNYSLNPDAMRNRGFDTVEVRTIDAADWASEHLAGFDRLILKTDTQGSDESIASRIPIVIWRKVAFACLEIWRIEKPAFDQAAFREIVASFPHWSFRGVRNCAVEEIVDYSSGDDWLFHDLYLWR